MKRKPSSWSSKTCGKMKYLRNSLVSRSLPCGLAVPACPPPRAVTLHPRAAPIADPCRAEKESPGGEILKEKQPRRKADEHPGARRMEKITQDGKTLAQSTELQLPHAPQGLHRPDIQQTQHASRQVPIARSSRIQVRGLPNNRPPNHVPTKREKSKRAGTRTLDGGSGCVQGIRVGRPQQHVGKH